MMTGLQPREFTWVISGRLAVSERIGGHGFQHRRVRREEEIAWIVRHGVTTVLSLLEGNQNLGAYRAAGLTPHNVAMGDIEPETVRAVLEEMHEILRDSKAVLLVHRDTLDDPVCGLLAAYLVFSGLIRDPIVATAMIQEILKRPLGPSARGMIPQTTGA